MEYKVHKIADNNKGLSFHRGHLPNKVLDSEKFRIYSSSTIIDNVDRLMYSCESIKNNVVEYLNLPAEDPTTTWRHERYNFWTHAMKVDPLFIRVWEDLVHTIRKCSPEDAKYAWIQSWLNFDTFDTVESNLQHHAHNCHAHGYVAISPQHTKTVFDEWEIDNAIGNIYCGAGKWKHHVKNTAKYLAPRITIGYDVVYGDGPWEDWDGISYQHFPWHEHFIPIILKESCTKN